MGPTQGPDPIRTALESRDHAAMVALLAPDVVLHSPVNTVPLRGRHVVATVLAGLLKASEQDIDAWHVRHTFREGATYVVAFGGRIHGHELDLVNVMRVTDQFVIEEMTVYGRPMSAVAIFPAYVFPDVARLRSRTRSELVRVIGRPLPLALELGARLATWIGYPTADLEARD